MSGVRRFVVPLTAAVVVGVAGVAIAVDRYTRADAMAVAEAYADALRAHDATAIVSLYGEPFTYEDPGLGTHLVTREGIRDWYWNLFIPSVRFEIGPIVADDRAAAVRWVWSGIRVWSDGTPYSIQGVSLLKVDGGRIVHEVVFYDPAPFRQPRATPRP